VARVCPPHGTRLGSRTLETIEPQEQPIVGRVRQRVATGSEPMSMLTAANDSPTLSLRPRLVSS